jgi:hypothetical protein
MNSKLPNTSDEPSNESEPKYADDQLPVDTEEHNPTFWQSVQPVTLRNVGVITVCALLITTIWAGSYYYSHLPQVLPIDMWRLSSECREQAFSADRIMDSRIDDDFFGIRNSTRLSRQCSREYNRVIWPVSRSQHEPWRYTKGFALIPEFLHRENARNRQAQFERKPLGPLMGTTLLYQFITSQVIQWGIVTIGLLRYVVKGGTRLHRLRETCERVALKVFEWYPYSSALTTMAWLYEGNPSTLVCTGIIAWIFHFLCWRVLLTIHLARYPARARYIRIAFFIVVMYFDKGGPASLLAPRLSWALGNHLVPLIANFALPPRDDDGDLYRGKNLQDPAMFAMVCLLRR